MNCDDLIGKKFGRLTVTSRAENAANGKARWYCVCDCGNKKMLPVVGYDLKTGKVRSCGCAKKEANKGRNKRHGMTGTRIHRIWNSMKQRCKKNEHYKNVSVCKEWESFESFYEWAVKNGYSEDLTIDRIDPRGDYSPDNCRWASYKVQQNNRTNNRKVSINGITRNLSEWAEIIGISSATLAGRLDSGWSEEELFLEPYYGNKAIRRAYHA